MRMFLGFSVVAMMAGCAASAQTPAAKHGMVLDDLAKIFRVGAPRLSPDGAWILYTVGKTDVGEDKSASQLWMVSWDGKQSIQLTFGKDGAGDPQWSPDGKYISFTSGREGRGEGIAGVGAGPARW